MPDNQTTIPLWRNRAFKWLLAGSTFSMLGSRLTTIAYPLLILAWHGSAVVAGLAVCAANAPSLLVYMPAGVLVDRWTDPRRTLIVAEILRGAAIAAIICLLALNWKCVPLVIAVAIVEESVEVFALLAERRYVRALVEPDHAALAQAGMEARSHVVVLAGRALGGLLFGIAQCFPFIADFLSFWVSALAVAGIGRGEKQVIAPKRAARPNLRSLMGEMRVGWNELFTDAFAFHASLLSAGMTLIIQALIIVFLASAHDKHVSSVVIGSVLAMSGLGGLIGAMASRRNRRPWGMSPLKFQPLVWTGMLLVLAVAGSLMAWVMAAVMAVLGLVGAMGNVELDTYLFVKVPKEKLARVTSVEMLLDFLASALGPALGGFLIETRGAESSIWVLLAVSGVVAILALRLRVPSITPAAAASRWWKERILESPVRVRSVRVRSVRGPLPGSLDGQPGTWQQPVARRSVARGVVAGRPVSGEALSALRSTPSSGFPQAAATHCAPVSSLWKRQSGARLP